MEKYFRLLNPKSVNYEADRIDGGSQSLTAQDVLLAMSYAKLTPLQDNLIRLKCFNVNTDANVRLLAGLLVKKYLDMLTSMDIKHEYHYVVVYVALVEFCCVSADYRSSSRKRAVIAGVEYRIIFRYLAVVIDMVFKDLCKEYRDGEYKVFCQIDNTNLN